MNDIYEEDCEVLNIAKLWYKTNDFEVNKMNFEQHSAMQS